MGTRGRKGEKAHGKIAGGGKTSPPKSRPGQGERGPIPLPKKGQHGEKQKKKPPGGGLGGQPISPERMAWASSLAK